MAPIQVGFIGLTSNPANRPDDGARWANNAHLKYLQENGGKYKIVALLNSSKKSAERAAVENGLGDVATYGDAEEFASDPNIDLVVVSVRVDRHHPVVKPSILAGKDVFVEWPLGANLDEAQELLTLANQKKIKTAVGLQAVLSPVVEKLKELVDSGRIGRVLSSTWVGVGHNGGTSVSGVTYLADRKVGGNMLTIHFGHSIDPILYVLGELKSYNSLLAVQRKTINIVNQEGEILEKDSKKDTPDQILLQGTTESGAVLSFHLREDKPFPGAPALVWSIYGDKGEIRLTSPRTFLNIGDPDIKIEIAESGSEKAEVVEVGKDEWENLSWPGKNIARIYEAFAEGRNSNDGKGGYRDFELAVKRHKLIDEMWKKYDDEQQA